jgi:hypothetical protein
MFLKGDFTMIKNKMLSIMLVVSMTLLVPSISFGGLTIASGGSHTVADGVTQSYSALDMDGGTLTVEVGGSISFSGESFMAADDNGDNEIATMNVYGTATFASEANENVEFKLGQYAGDIATINVGNGTDVATMYLEYIQASSSGGVSTININTNGTLTADDGHIYAGTSVNLLGGTFRIKNKDGGIIPDVPETGNIFGLTSSDTIASGGVDVEVIGDYTVYSVPEPCTLALLGLGGLVLRRRRKA